MGKSQTVLFTLFFLSIMSFSLNAQTVDKKETEKTTTLDTWRQAMPQNEQPAYIPPAAETGRAENEDSPAQVKKIIIDLEGKFMAALKDRDASGLDTLLANDFAPVGILLPGSADKPHFIDWAVKSFQLKSYAADKTRIRLYQGTAIVTTSYKRQASISGVPADGDFIVTNVWIRRDEQWQMVSHHLSQAPKS